MHQTDAGKSRSFTFQSPQWLRRNWYMKFLRPIECDFSCECTGKTRNWGNVSKIPNEMHFVAAHKWAQRIKIAGEMGADIISSKLKERSSKELDTWRLKPLPKHMAESKWTWRENRILEFLRAKPTKRSRNTSFEDVVVKQMQRKIPVCECQCVPGKAWHGQRFQRPHHEVWRESLWWYLMREGTRRWTRTLAVARWAQKLSSTRIWSPRLRRPQQEQCRCFLPPPLPCGCHNWTKIWEAQWWEEFAGKAMAADPRPASTWISSSRVYLGTLLCVYNKV